MSKSINFDKVLKELKTARYKFDNKIPVIKGVKGLSPSDVDMTTLYVEEFAKYGPYLANLMEPRGKVEELLSMYDIKFNSNKTF